MTWFGLGSADGHRGGTWILEAAKAFCREVGTTVVGPQGLRATHGQLARSAGYTAHVVAQQLGHANTRVTTESYIGTDTEEQERSKAALRILRGGQS